jgi:hypothetical protein
MIAKAMRAILLASATGDKLEGLGLHELLREGSQRVFVWLAMIEDRMRAHDEQFSQISIAHFRDAAQTLLASGRVLSRRQAKKGGELARPRERGDILNARGHRRGRHRLGMVISRHAISSSRAIAAIVLAHNATLRSRVTMRYGASMDLRLRSR